MWRTYRLPVRVRGAGPTGLTRRRAPDALLMRGAAARAPVAVGGARVNRLKGKGGRVSALRGAGRQGTGTAAGTRECV